MKYISLLCSILLIIFLPNVLSAKGKSPVSSVSSCNSALDMCVPMPVVIYVDSAGTLGGNGKNWSTAFRYLQDGLARAALLAGSGMAVHIWVAGGTYYPDDDEGGNVTDGDSDAAFTLHNNVSVYGGFHNFHTSISHRDWNSNPTILSGDINQTANGSAYHVINNNYTKGSPLNATAVISGFFIEGAIANYSPSPMGDRNYGGGIFNRYASPTISYCTIRDNDASFGGAMFNENSDPIITNSLIYNNQAFEIGDVMFNNSSDLSLINCTVSENKGLNNGNFSDTSIYNSKSNIIITNSILWNNNKEIHNVTSTPVVTNSIVQGGYVAGTDIIDQDPLFVDVPDNFDIRICSPAINNGSNAVSIGAQDYGGNVRLLHAVFDIGAYEFNTGILYVNHKANGLNDGTSWINAYEKLQDALLTLAACESPGQVWVAQGTYYPDEGHGQPNNSRNRSFTMPHDVQIYGGFAAFESQLSERDWIQHLTILSGDIDQNDHTGSLEFNSFNVVHNNHTSANPLTASARLDGFTVMSGNANQAFLNDEGGGMRNENSSPTIINCTFLSNNARFGAGIHNDSSDVTLINCFFLRNIAEVQGGGVRHLRGNLTLANCTFDTNHSGNVLGSDGGGGLSFRPFATKQLIMDDCTFMNNTTDGHAGAVLLDNGAIPPLAVHNFNNCNFNNNSGRFSGAIAAFDPLNLSACSFEENQVVPGSSVTDRYFGGALLVIGDSINIDNCNFIGNKTDQYGGALASTLSGIVNVTNSLFSQNQANYFTFQDPDFVEPRGGAVYIEVDSKGIFLNCDFEENYAERKGGAFYSASDFTELINCRFWNNRTNEFAHSIYNDAADTKIINCTFANNNVNNVGEIVYNDNNSNPIITNSILWKFGVSDPPRVLSDDQGSTSTVSYSIVQGGWASGSNITAADPKFTDCNTGDLTLQNCSPAIDMGANIANNTSFDISNNPRLHNATGANKARIDLGSYEFQGIFSASCSCPDDLHVGMNIATGTYNAGLILTSDGQIVSGANVIFSAGNYTELQDNFEVPTSSILEILLGGCQ